MSLTGRSRIAIGLTVGALLGILIAGVLLLFHGIWRPGVVVTNAVVQTHNGHQSVTWTLIPHRMVGIQVTASDPAYSRTWADRDMWRQGERWDEITVTVGDKDGSFVLEYGAKTRARGMSGGSSAGSGAKSFVFTDLRRRGYAPLGSGLGRFTLETVGGHVVEGRVSLVEVKAD